jgi:hypothetical protein
MLKNDYIPFQVQPVAGYTDLFSANDRLVQHNHDVPNTGGRNLRLTWVVVEDDCIPEFGGFDEYPAGILSAHESRRVAL